MVYHVVCRIVQTPHAQELVPRLGLICAKVSTQNKTPY